MKKKKNKKEDLPGYPHYKEADDITAVNREVDADLENYSTNAGKIKSQKSKEDKPSGPDVKLKRKPGKNDLTRDDLTALGGVDEDMDEGEDETLLPYVQMNEELLGGDLDVPGNDEDDEDIDADDEENNLFSRGQD